MPRPTFDVGLRLRSRLDVIESSHVQLLLLKLSLDPKRLWRTLWLLCLLLHWLLEHCLHHLLLLLQLRRLLVESFLHHSQQLCRFRGFVLLSER